MHYSDNPRHIAIIMDGNRRWAAERGKPKMLGHTEGAKNIKRIIQTAKSAGIPYLTLWALSTENLQRSADELKHLFSLFERLADYIPDLLESDVRVRIIGNLSLLPAGTAEKLREVEEKTKANASITVSFAIAYGGRDEIIRAINTMGVSAPITESEFPEYLDTADLPDPDLIIRTGGRHRLSGFLPWQSVYSELYFTDTYWPVFDEAEFQKSIAWFKEQQRNIGK